VASAPSVHDPDEKTGACLGIKGGWHQNMHSL